MKYMKKKAQGSLEYMMMIAIALTIIIGAAVLINQLMSSMTLKSKADADLNKILSSNDPTKIGKALDHVREFFSIRKEQTINFGTISFEDADEYILMKAGSEMKYTHDIGSPENAVTGDIFRGDLIIKPATACITVCDPGNVKSSGVDVAAVTTTCKAGVAPAGSKLNPNDGDTGWTDTDTKALYIVCPTIAKMTLNCKTGKVVTSHPERNCEMKLSIEI